MRWLILVIFLTACSQRSPTIREYYSFLQGTWESTCFNDQEGFKIQEMTYQESEVRFVEKIYGENTCSTLLYQVETVSSYSLGINMDVLLPRSVQIFYTVQLVHLTILDNNAVAIFNTDNRCGYSNWVYALTKDVNSRNCQAGSKNMPTVDQRYLNLIKVENNKLFIGDDSCELDNSCISYYGQKYPNKFYPQFLIKK